MDSGVPDLRGQYLRIADELRQQITSGRLAVGQALPSYSQISASHGVSPGTAQRAVGVLRDEGYVMSANGRGSYVVSNAPAVEEDPTVRKLREVFTRLDTLDTEVARLQKLVDQEHRRRWRGRSADV